MVFDYSNLKGEIKKKYTYKELASATGIGFSTITDHIRKGQAFSIEQVMKIMSALSLSITSEQIIDLFFVIRSWNQDFERRKFNGKQTRLLTKTLLVIT